MRRFLIVVLVASASLALPSTGSAAAPGCGDTISTSATLTIDVGTSSTGCSGNGLVIDTSGVTLDLAHHTIWGDNIGASDYGVRIQPSVSDVTIKNGSIRDFVFGIGSGGSSDKTTIDHVVLGRNGTGILMPSSATHVTATKVVAVSSTSDGIAVSGDDSSVTDSVVTNSNGRGIVVDGLRETVTNGIASKNGDNGIVIGSGTVKSSRSIANTGDGVVAMSAPSTLSKNAVFANTGNGINVTGFSSTIDSNRIVANGLDGIHTSSQDVVVSNNAVDSNDDDGIDLSADDSKVTGNRVRANGKDSDDFGIELSGNNIAVKSNTVQGNNSDGMHWDAASVGSATKNILTGNGFGTGGANNIGEGLDTNGQTVTASDNIAKANDAHDCAPVGACTYGATSATQALRTCGETITQSTQLSADVAGTCTGDGLIVGKDGITIDLGGHTITGNGAIAGGGANAGIDIGTHQDVTIKNGRLIGFDHGIYSGDAADADALSHNVTIDGVLASGGRFGFKLQGKDSVLKNSAAAGSHLGYDMLTGTAAMKNCVANGGTQGVLLSSKKMSATGCVVRYSTGLGMDLNPAGVAKNNVVAHTTNVGINAEGGLVKGNEVARAGYPAVGMATPMTAIFVHGGTKPTVSGNFGIGSADGVDAAPDGSLVKNNEGDANTNSGVGVTGVGSSMVNNVGIANGFAGVYGVGSESQVSGALGIGNKYGVYDVFGSHALITGSTAYGNGDAGVTFNTTTGGKLIDNVGDGNGYATVDHAGLGIYGGAIGTGHGNSGLGNDDPAECTPGFC